MTLPLLSAAVSVARVGATVASAQPGLDRLDVKLTEVSVDENRIRVVGAASNRTHPARDVIVELKINNLTVGRATAKPPSHRFATDVAALPGERICAIPTRGVGGPSCLHLPYNTPPNGALDRVDSALGRPIAGAIRVAGWALDPDTPAPIPVEVTIDDRRVARVLAEGRRPDVAAMFPNSGDRHGFDTTIAAQPGARICVVAINDSGPPSTLGCQSLRPGVVIQATARGRPPALLTGEGAWDRFRARSDDKVEVTIAASDRRFGLRRLTVETTRTLACLTAAGKQLATRTQSSSDVRPPNSPPTVLRPTSLSTRRGIDITSIRASCRPGRFREVHVLVRVTAINGLGSVRREDSVITSFGPDLLRVGTFNMNEKAGHKNAEYEAWAQSLGRRADVLALSEVHSLKRLRKVARAGGFSHFVVDAHRDVAIMSRGPIADVTSATLEPDGGASRSGSHNVEAFIELDGYPHQFIAMHWAINNADNEPQTPNVALEGHYRAAKWVISRLRRGGRAPDYTPTFVAGDTNALSGYPNPDSQEFPGITTPAMQLLATHLTDALRFFVDHSHVDPGGLVCSNKRIDYVFSIGSYEPILYECFSNDEHTSWVVPSDHPFVLVTYAVQDRPSDPSGPVSELS